MKRIVASVGLAALGAATIQSSSAQSAIGGDGTKPWTVSASLRGFYDDNVNTSAGKKTQTFGFEASPTIGIEFPMDQTTASLLYTYSYKYYDKRPAGQAGHDDQTHTIAARLMHAFSERTTLSLSDSFVIGQEPDVLRSGNSTTAFNRIPGNNIRNYGAITLNHQFTRQFGMEAGYANAFYDYEDNKFAVQNGIGGDPFGIYPVIVTPVSRSGLLNRMEQAMHADARWTVQPNTVALIGYQYRFIDYTANEPIGVVGPDANIAHNSVIYSQSRNSRSHYGYVGLEHTFRTDFIGSVRAGVVATDYYNSPDKVENISPYVSANLRYVYAKDSSISVGVSHDNNATDAFSVNHTSITADTESTVAFASITHRLLPSLYGTLMGQYQYSTFNGGQFNNTSEEYYIFSGSLEYRINRHVSATLSYNYDRLDSAVTGRGFDRNRVFVGATVTY